MIKLLCILSLKVTNRCTQEIYPCMKTTSTSGREQDDKSWLTPESRLDKMLCAKDKPQLFILKLPEKPGGAQMEEIKEPSMETTCLSLCGHLRKSLHGKCSHHPSFWSLKPSWLSEAFPYLANPNKFSPKEIFKCFLFITCKWKMQWGWVWLGFCNFQLGYQVEKSKQFA